MIRIFSVGRRKPVLQLFKKVPHADHLPSQAYFDDAVVMVAMVKAGVELAFETMVASGIKPESASYSQSCQP